MELAPRYCRTCGSRILIKHICHNCNNEPLKGGNYCYNCGALTPNADGCLKCGAKYKKRSFVKPLIMGSFAIIAAILAGYFISSSDDTQKVSPGEDSSQIQALRQPQPAKPEAQNPVINNPVDTVQHYIPQDTIKQKINTDTIGLKNNPADSAKQIKTEPQTFTAEDLKTYNIRCSYFKKNMRSQVLFFMAAGKGYIKVNNKIYELQRKHKGVDEASFSGNEYEAKIIIKGLSGTAQDWLAACTLVIKDLTQKTSVKRIVYSHCIEL